MIDRLVKMQVKFSNEVVYWNLKTSFGKSPSIWHHFIFYFEKNYLVGLSFIQSLYLPILLTNDLFCEPFCLHLLSFYCRFHDKKIFLFSWTNDKGVVIFNSFWTIFERYRAISEILKLNFFSNMWKCWQYIWNKKCKVSIFDKKLKDFFFGLS